MNQGLEARILSRTIEEDEGKKFTTLLTSSMHGQCTEKVQDKIDRLVGILVEERDAKIDFTRAMPLQ